jgi:hypothetical protein
MFLMKKTFKPSCAMQKVQGCLGDFFTFTLMELMPWLTVAITTAKQGLN